MSVPERIVHWPDVVIERDVCLAAVDGRRGEPFDVREHVGLIHELAHLLGLVGTLDGGVVLCPEPGVDVVVHDALGILPELLEGLHLPVFVQ